MSRYEGLFIFPDALKDDTLEAAITQVRGEIEKLDGSVDSIARMGRKTFARPIQKQTSGNYVVMNITMDGTKIPALNKRLKLKSEVIRVQFLNLPDDAPALDDTKESSTSDSEDREEAQEKSNAVS